jgi:hypothetical protein
MTRKVTDADTLERARRKRSMKLFAHRLEADLLRPPMGYVPNIKAPSDPKYALRVLVEYVEGLAKGSHLSHK